MILFSLLWTLNSNIEAQSGKGRLHSFAWSAKLWEASVPFQRARNDPCLSSGHHGPGKERVTSKSSQDIRIGSQGSVGGSFTKSGNEVGALVYA